MRPGDGLRHPRTRAATAKRATAKAATAKHEARIQEALRSRERRHRAFLLTVGAIVVAWLVGQWAFNAYQDYERKATAARKNVHGERVWAADALKFDHVEGNVDYPMTPPVGGSHDKAWMTCNGTVYTKAIRDENAVHSLEHGAVWITYNGLAGATDVKQLAERVARTPYTLMSPVAQQSGTIMLSAWGHQLTVDTASDPRVEQFITAYVQGPQTPEPGAACTGGITGK
ncbi:DUF3105 domain-containing protein [Streptomyces sp. HC44]|uniref:DUF3105 domain-containing protein n=1 Tax=Streptomyces scabichelini TaxID=2711217 RepID=A0A6G4V9I1_9ACTN|nr:DUF3105 domain-containing protein [Streptomyces scabichelini]NGO10739.1 DUF3105 domain-containing protein [Streptomyces scabichelini]